MATAASATFKYQRIADDMRRRVDARDWHVGDRLPGEQELAAEYGVSHLTLRRAMALLEDEGLIQRRRRSGTYIARHSSPAAATTRRARAHPRPPARSSTAAPATATRQLVYVGQTVDHGYDRLYVAIQAATQAQGTMLAAFNPQLEADPATLPQRLATILSGADRIIVGTAWFDLVVANAEPDAHIVACDLHSIESLGRNSPRFGYGVTIDWRAAADAATTHLLELGHRHIVLLENADNAAPGDLFAEPGRNRSSVEGYMQTLLAAGHTPWLMGQRWDDEASTPAALAELLARMAPHSPTAFVCCGDFRAAPLIQALRNTGLQVPGDVSVVGIGDTAWCTYMSPPLSSVAVNETELARLAVLLVDQAPPASPSIIRVHPRIVVRRTSAPPKA